MTLYEVDEAASRVRQEVDPEANIIVGATFDEQLGDRLRVSIVASGMNRMSEQLSAPKGQRSAARHVSGCRRVPRKRAKSKFLSPRSLHKRLGAAATGPVPPPPGDLQRRLSDALQPMPPNPLQNFSPSGHNEQIATNSR